MKGTVYAINNRNGMIAAYTENGDYSVFEVLGSDIVELRDEVMWKDDTSLGSTKLSNLTTRQTFEVFFQNHWVSKDNLAQQLGII